MTKIGGKPWLHISLGELHPGLHWEGGGLRHHEHPVRKPQCDVPPLVNDGAGSPGSRQQAIVRILLIPNLGSHILGPTYPSGRHRTSKNNRKYFATGCYPEFVTPETTQGSEAENIKYRRTDPLEANAAFTCTTSSLGPLWISPIEKKQQTGGPLRCQGRWPLH